MDQALRAGRWQHMPCVELHGKTFGFIGLGLIAAHVAPILRALGLRLLDWSLTDDRVANILAFLDGQQQYVVTPPDARQL